MERYRFIIENPEYNDFHTLDTEKVSAFKLKFKKEKDEEYVRIFPGGQVTLTNKEDFNWLMGYENNSAKRCSKFLFHLELYCSGTYKRYQTFKFSLNNSKPCLDTCEISIDLQINDIYECLKEGDKERNVLQTPDLVEKTVDSYPDFNNLEFYLTVTTNSSCNTTTAKPPTDPTSWGLFGCSNTTLGTAGSGCQQIYGKVWARKVVKRSCVAGSPLTLPPGGVLISNSCSLDGTYTYAQPYTGSVGSYVFGNNSASGQAIVFSSHADLSHTCISDPLVTAPYIFTNSDDITTLCQNPPYADTSESLKYCFYLDKVKLEVLTSKTTYDRGRDYLDTLLWLANQSCPSINCIESLFMNKNVNDAGANNYVTGLPNQLGELLLFEKSDMVTPNSSEKATILNLTFKSLYETLKRTINARFVINKDGCLVIEHISKLKSDQNIVLDLTQSDALDGFCCYEYETGKIPSRETWKYQEASGLDFVGEPIEYNLSDGTLNPCATSEESNIDLSYLTTDLDFIQETSEDDQTLDGFVMISNEDDGNSGRKVTSEEGKLTGSNILNGHLSNANLQHNYHCHNRALIIGVMNAIFRSFCSETKKKKGQDFEINMCCEDLINFDPNGLVKTKFGNGDIEEGTYDLTNQILTLNLIY